MDHFTLEYKIKSDPKTYYEDYKEQLRSFESLLTLCSPPVKQIASMIPFVLNLSHVDPVSSMRVLDIALNNIKDVGIRKSILNGLIRICHKNYTSPSDLFRKVLMFGHDFSSYINSLQHHLDLDCYDVLVEWYNKGNEKQKSFCYYFILMIFNNIHEFSEESEYSGTESDFSTENKVKNKKISKNLLSFKNGSKKINLEEIEKIICEALFKTSKLSKICMLYFLNRTEIKFDVSRFKNGAEYAKRLYQELTNEIFDRDVTLMKMKVFIILKKHFQFNKTITNLILKMIDLEKPDIKDLLMCLVDSTTRNEVLGVFKVISEEMVNENKEDDVICYGMNVMREIYYKMADIKKPEVININEELDDEESEDFEFESESGESVDEENLKEIKEAVLRHVECFKGKRSRQVQFSYKALMKAVIKNEAIDKPVEYLAKSMTKEERVLTKKKGADERKKELAEEKREAKKRKRGSAKGKKSNKIFQNNRAKRIKKAFK